ncbi:P44/Msp2 family outer membrane protein [Wolbachia endosymbiont of Diaphorina citri]|jgi:Outer membrane protein W|uniref:P44/Msp2 family outer membrane protein n=1 Tax=Wolbachia endosymbiont of Diaphorina citri TaxID=116598 RepID=UPI0003098C7A|nr:P44/Msp2 family outer membrane protein [Wolbachia endosymbiont of Diaphorina citri]QJT94089.1 P44/Msp2 family outer membrane protein [Wolbachia endosymbiont of Diaphorina citri]QJT95330.1 P44/Msp2 family outer membrane protein [Wolbachia endosymbiont of Diaphorina citri]QJT96692.1 P44/Msp2 family outer membrane protein [Wolbachia endosymbiont of Diaphorina citri]QLK10988.1 P44/Msp2 family outer membrane protein [Wolbachia endosymbiont of Diaphorina citri]QXY87480.1 P44/Msp2 family outer mem
MMSKKTLAVTALALLLSQQSFASETEGFYFGGGYYGQYLNLGKLKAKIGDKDATDDNKVFINDRNTEKTEPQQISKYKADYSPPFAANIAFGYTGELGNNSYRAELEGMYSSIKVNNIGLANTQMNIKYEKENNEYGITINHDKIDNISVMANVYHHWKNDSFSFSPYVGIGVGATRMTMFEKSSIRPAGQLKAGFDYHINEDVNMHIGYRGFGVIGSSEYKPETLKLDAKTNKMAQQTGDNKMTTTIQNSFFHTHGIEAGLTFHFASKA